MVNTDRLHQVLTHIKSLPDAVKLNLDNNYAVPMWDQRKWMSLPDNTLPEGSCGTSGCFAGWTVMLFVPEFKLDIHSRDMNMIHNVIIDGESHPIEELARELLGLNGFEADTLFDYANEIDDLEAIINHIGLGKYDPEFDDREDLI